MVTYLLGLLLHVGALMLQTSVVSQVHLLQGAGDLVLLTMIAWLLHKTLPRPWLWPLVAGLLVGWVSALPWWAAVLGYGLAGGLTLALRERLWHSTLWLYLFLAVIGGPIIHLFAWVALWTQGISVPWSTALSAVIVPSMLLNALLALPVHSVVNEVAAWVLPEEEEA